MRKNIRISMLGGLSVRFGSAPVLEATHKINKPWQVYSFLALNRKQACLPARLIGELWEPEQLTDAGNVLKNTVYALRKEFSASAADINPVIFQGGGYLCNPKYNYWVDCEVYEALCNHAAEQTGAEKCQTLTEALHLYRGDFLPSLQSEQWAHPYWTHYKALFLDNTALLLQTLEHLELWEDLRDASQAALAVDPCQPGYHLAHYRALTRLGLCAEMVALFPETRRIFAEEINRPVPEEILHQYDIALLSTPPTDQQLGEIRQSLTADAADGTDRPLCCTYDVFKYLYQNLARIEERNRSNLEVLLLTIADGSGATPAPAALEAVMVYTRDVLSGSLRRNDVFSRYSKNQYVILLCNNSPAGCDIVANRLQQRCSSFLEPRELTLRLGSFGLALGGAQAMPSAAE